MFRIDKNATLEELIEIFRNGLIHKNRGFDEEDKKMEREGFRMQVAAIKRIDKFGEVGRQALVKLMNTDPEQGVRIWAAAELMDDRPEVALPVLKDMHENGKFKLRSAAWALLMGHELENNAGSPAAINAARRRAELAEAAARYEAETAKAKAPNGSARRSRPS